MMASFFNSTFLGKTKKRYPGKLHECYDLKLLYYIKYTLCTI